MEKTWVLPIAIAVFFLLNFLYYKSLKGYIRKEFGVKWLKIWGNKFYFWQSSIFVSAAGTVLILYLLKWSNILTF